MLRILAAIVAALLFGSQTVSAQSPTGSLVVSSEPGRAMASQTVELAAVIAAINQSTRTVTLKGPKGTADIVAGEEVRNFDQLRVGDNVVVRYQEALSLELKKSHRSPDRVDVEASARAEPGARPGAATSRTVTVLADVVAVDPEKSVISLKGPRGVVVDLQVKNPDHFKVVKVGDQVEAVYIEAMAVMVRPAGDGAAQPTR